MFSQIRNRIRNLGPERSRRLSLAFRLTAWYSTAAFLVVVLTTGLFYLALSTNLKTLSQQLLEDEVHVCRALVPNGFDALREEAEVDSAIRKYEKFYVRILDEHGLLLAVTPGMDGELSSSRVAQEDARDPGGFLWLQSPGRTPYRALVAKIPVADSGGTRIWTLQVAVDLTQEMEVLSRLRVWVWTILAEALVLCPWVGYVIARRGTAPLREVADIARLIGSSTLHERIRTEGYPTEVAVLAETFNAMLQRLEESFVRLSRFSADIAHELRTPVNNIRGQSEVALARARSPEEYRDVLASCLEESVRLSELIESLLFLAKTESPGDHLNRKRIDIGELLDEVRDYYEAAALEAGVKVLVADGNGVSASVDRRLLQRALGNLVSNALANTLPGGTIRLSARRVGEQIDIEIGDTGVGIPAEALPRLFDRFYRADPARARNSGGSGLGLAIVRQIVLLHGGEVQIASEVGQGSTVSVMLPADS